MERRSRGGEVERWIRAGQKHLRHIKAGDKLKVRSSTAVAMEPNLRNGIYGPVDPVITVVSVGFEYVASSKRQVMVLTFLDESKRVQLSRGRILWCDPSVEKACEFQFMKVAAAAETSTAQMVKPSPTNACGRKRRKTRQVAAAAAAARATANAVDSSSHMQGGLRGYMGNYLGYDDLETLDCVQRENDVLAADRSVDDVCTLVRQLYNSRTGNHLSTR